MNRRLHRRVAAIGFLGIIAILVLAAVAIISVLRASLSERRKSEAELLVAKETAEATFQMREFQPVPVGAPVIVGAPIWDIISLASAEQSGGFASNTYGLGTVPGTVDVRAVGATILSTPLLLETSQKQRADTIVVVDVPEETQLARTQDNRSLFVVCGVRKQSTCL